MNKLFVPTNWDKYNIYVIAHRLHPLGWRFKESIATGETDRFNVPTYSFTFTSVINEYRGYTLTFTQTYDKQFYAHWNVSLTQSTATAEGSGDSGTETASAD